MGAAPGAGWDEGEFEFKLVFEEESQGPSPVRTSEPDSSESAEKNEATLDCSHTSNLGSTHFSDDCMFKVNGPCSGTGTYSRERDGSLYQFMCGSVLVRAAAVRCVRAFVCKHAQSVYTRVFAFV